MLAGIIIGVFSGLILGLLIAFFISPSLMFREDNNHKDFDETVSALEKAMSAAAADVEEIIAEVMQE